MKKSRLTQLIFFVLICGLVLSLAIIPFDHKTQAFHTEAELEYFRKHEMTSALPPIPDTYFQPSSICSGCHTYDFNEYAYVDSEGNDVNLHDDWRSSMMANSAKDPFWRAKVSHEVLVNPAHKEDIETACTKCHAPLGHYNALFEGKAHYTMDDLLADTIGLDGISCTACHQMSAEGIGQTFNGNITYDTLGNIYGPFENVFAPPMQAFFGATPQFGAHINDAGLCASCHTLIVETLDLDGNPTGNSYVEQATYHEWVNSKYEVEHVTCQECHLPRIEDEIVIATGYSFLQGKSPFGLHELAGANTMMLKLMRDNREVLDIDATAEHFDSTLAATYRMLQQKSLDIQFEMEKVDEDTAFFHLTLTNKAGHKFPSGYPSRRAFVEFVVTYESGDTLFHSGKMDDEYALSDLDPEYEPHYDVVTEEHQVQVYELVNGDIEGNFSTVLERGYSALKDNRLVPQGFKRSHYTYDTVKIVGNAATDLNFGAETTDGSDGSDRIEYRVHLDGYVGNVDVVARIYYQSLPPRWMAEMFSASTPQIAFFKDMYDAADRSPVLVGESILEDVMVEGSFSSSIATVKDDNRFEIFPNPTLDGKINVRHVQGENIGTLSILSADGRLLQTRNNLGPSEVILLPAVPGVYYLEMNSGKEKIVKSVVRK